MKIQEILTDFILQRFKMKKQTKYFKLTDIISHILKYFKLTYIIEVKTWPFYFLYVTNFSNNTNL